MNVKLSRQQRRALERSQKKEQSTEQKRQSAQHQADSYDIKLFENTANTQISTSWMNDQGIKNPVKADWVGSDKKVEVAGRTLPGMLFVGKPPTITNQYGDSVNLGFFYINPDLEVGNVSPLDATNLESIEWSYDQFTPTDRANYLDWLSSTPLDWPRHEAFIVMYFSGLEYAYFNADLDQTEKRVVFNAAVMLLETFSTLSATFHIKEFVRFTLLNEVNQNYLGYHDRLDFDDNFLVHRIEGGLNTIKRKPLEGIHVFSALNVYDNNTIKNAWENSPFVFQMFFERKFLQTYPDGLKIKKPNKSLYKRYESFKLTFKVSDAVGYGNHEVPDLEQSEQITEIATEIGLQAAENLKPYSNEIKKRVQHIIDNKQYVFLPQSESNNAITLADYIIEEYAIDILNKAPGAGIFEFGLLMDFLQFYEISNEDWFRLVVAFERVGYGVAPEFGPYINEHIIDFPVHLFKFKSLPEQRTSGSGKYYTLLISFAIGFALIDPNTILSEEYLEIMLNQIDSTPTLKPFEKELLMANFEVYQDNILDANYVCKLILSKFDFDATHIRGAIKEYIEFDNSMSKGKLFTLLIFYMALGFDYHDIPSDLSFTASQRAELIALEKELEKKNEVKTESENTTAGNQAI